MKKILLPVLGLILAAGYVQGKKVLDHTSFDAWKSVSVSQLSRDGRWSAYAVNPQEGDGVLTLRNNSNGKTIAIDRGHTPRFTADSRYAVALIKPHFKDTRQAKIDKKKDFDMPQDSLAIVDLRTGKVTKYPRVIGFKLPKEGSGWVAWQSCDTTLITEKALKDKKAGRPLVVLPLDGGKRQVINWVKNYSFSEDGRRLAATLVKQKKDTTATNGVGILNLPDTNFILIDRDKPYYGAPVFNMAGDRLSYVASTDSADTGTRRSRVYLADLTASHPTPAEVLTQLTADGDTLFINQYTVPKFSHDGRRLIAGVAPYIAPDDTTIVDFERAELDIWRWDAPYTPPQELKNVENLRKHTFPTVIDLDNMGNPLLVTANPLVTVAESDRWDGRYVMLRDPSETVISQQWDYSAPEQLSVLDLQTGERRNAGTAPIDCSDISPAGNFVIWYTDKAYYTFNNKTGETVEITKDIPYPIWDEEQDIPLMRQPYGIAGWMQGDDAVLIYDKHDIWSLDPTGKRAPVNMTKGDGRNTNRRYRFIKTDPEQRFFKPGEQLLLQVFDYTDKRNGLATAQAGRSAAPSLKALDTYSFTQIRKAKNADTYAFQKANFNTSPDVWVATSGNFAGAKKVTDANPQMKDYNWGDAQLVKWYSFSGDPTEGVLYTPEDLDPSKKYPMLVVFYERNSEELYRHYTMEPSWSWVNYPFYVSRGYVIFVPDVKYAPGIPGESAYNYICSGVEELCKKYPWIDRDRIGIDGQSWGGYQTAYLVTRTDMFACAGSGAPVANMTSAFGGIRWGTGDSRQAQYEKGQSRIGRNLWEAPQLYIANTPVFYADRVKTPLLIMHNDEDGAVPWYQGIEMFMALRRLHKPVWMLQYNGEAHNIRARKNRKDITIRLQQFFDHYLKGDPMPEWMKNGIPAIRKGQEMGTSLTGE